MNLDDYRKVQEYKKLGLSQKKVMDLTGMKEWDVRRCFNYSLEEFNKYLESKGSGIDVYKEYIMDILKITPTIPDTNIYYKIKEDFPDFSVGETSFKKYMKKLRKETGYDRFRNTKTAIRENPEPGEEAQVDFGQYKIKDMYGKKRLLYFIVVVLRYSQLKYVYFQTKDFNTLTAVEAHKRAFKFFGGIPKVLVYDQDKVFAISENYGNLILVKDFEEFIREYNLSIVMCSGYHPEGKGTVENYVKIVKNNFLDGRIYNGIDSLNSACLEWLDNTENNHILTKKGVTPHELFVEEAKYLKKIKPMLLNQDTIYYKVYGNYIKFRYSKYEVPIGYNDMEVIAESDGVNVIVKDKDNNQIIAVHPISTKKDERVRLSEKYDIDGVGEYLVKREFKDDIDAIKFLNELNTNSNRYYKKGCIKIKSLMNHYSHEELLSSFTFCVSNTKYSLLEFISYLIYKYGTDRGLKAIDKSNFSYYLKRSKEIEEELNGK